MRNSPFVMQQMPITKVVKWLMIINATVYVVGVVLLGGFTSFGNIIFDGLGFVPGRFIFEFWLWQPVTYMFVHSNQIFHVLFNIMFLWMLGSELEIRWGSRFFTLYYFVCGIGAALIYALGVLFYVFIFPRSGLEDAAHILATPVVGASGAVFGLMLAYGIHFGERIMLFLLIFPMKAKYMVTILGVIELISLVNSGPSNETANLAHLGGLISGFLFLLFWTRGRQWLLRGGTRKRGRNLKLVVDNERLKGEEKGPRFWN